MTSPPAVSRPHRRARRARSALAVRAARRRCPLRNARDHPRVRVGAIRILRRGGLRAPLACGLVSGARRKIRCQCICGGRPVRWIALERELPNFRVALAWTERSRGHRTWAADWPNRFFSSGMCAAIAPRAAAGSNARWRAIQAHRYRARAAALVQLGHIEHNLGNTEVGARHLNKALELALELDDRRSIAFALVLLAAFAVDAGDDEPAGPIPCGGRKVDGGPWRLERYPRVSARQPRNPCAPVRGSAASQGLLHRCPRAI